VIDVRLVSSFGEVGVDETQWNRLAACSSTNTVFQTHQWASSWLAAFGQEHEPRVLIATNSRGVAGIAPLVARRGHSQDGVLRFVGDGRADYSDFLADAREPGVTGALLGALLGERSWDIIELNNVPELSDTVRVVQASCRKAGFRVLTVEQFVCPTLLLDGRDDLATRIINKPSLRRRENYFRRRGRLVCRHLTSLSEIEPHLERFFAQHVARWAASPSPSLFVNERNRVFYRELAARLSPQGWLLFSVLEFDDQPIAFHFGFDYCGSVIWYKPSFDLSYAAGSPGLVLVRELISYALRHDRRELDFTVGAEPFKARFTNATRRTLGLRIYRSTARFAAAYSRRLLFQGVKGLRTGLAAQATRTLPEPSPRPHHPRRVR